MVAAIAAVALTAAPAPAEISEVVAEFLVNEETESDQFRPRLLRLTDGRYLVVWESTGQDGDGGGIYGRIYAEDHGGAGAEFRLNETTSRGQENPAVAALPGGGFVAVWESFRQVEISANDDVFGLIFDADGNPVGGEFLINQETVGNQALPNIASRADGRFVVAWDSQFQDGDDIGVFARQFQADGTAIGDEFQVNSYTTGVQTLLRSGAGTVAWYDASHFVVVWQSEYLDGDEYSVQGRRFGDDGVALDAEEFQVHETGTGNQSAPAVGSTGNNEFLVVWNDRQSDGETFVRRFAGNGAPDGPSVSAGAAASVSRPVVAAESGRTFWLGWTDVDANAGGVRSRRFDTAMLPISGDVVTNTYQTATQQDPSVVAGPDDEFIAVWESLAQDGSTKGVYGTVRAGQGRCGDATFDGNLVATDALFVLRTAVNLEVCSPCICDTNNSGGVTATDALLVLQGAVGLPVDIQCPTC